MFNIHSGECELYRQQYRRMKNTVQMEHLLQNAPVKMAYFAIDSPSKLRYSLAALRGKELFVL